MAPFPAGTKKHITRNLLLISSAIISGYKGYLEGSITEVREFLERYDVSKILFVPYAITDYNDYLNRVVTTLGQMGYQVYGIHTQKDEATAIRTAKALMVGGGNTHLLLKTLYDKNLIDVIREMVLFKGTPYIGVSAGCVIAAENIGVTVCKPVVRSPTIKALNLIPFFISPHYTDENPKTNTKDYTRDKRICNFLQYNSRPVVGLREGCSLIIDGDRVTLVGAKKAKLFSKFCYLRICFKTQDYEPNSDLSFLMTVKNSDLPHSKSMVHTKRKQRRKHKMYPVSLRSKIKI